MLCIRFCHYLGYPNSDTVYLHKSIFTVIKFQKKLHIVF